MTVFAHLQREKRVAFYANHNISWVARPPQIPSPDGEKRAGRFMKVSDMNYALALILCMETGHGQEDGQGRR